MTSLPPETEAVPGSVLVVEDDDDVREMIGDILEAEGITVEAAANGTAALSRAAAHWPAVLVMDSEMPSLDGTGLVEALREIYGKVPPIVLVTGDRDAASKARELGAIRHLRKPFELDDLVSAVQEGLAAA